MQTIWKPNELLTPQAVEFSRAVAYLANPRAAVMATQGKFPVCGDVAKGVWQQPSFGDGVRQYRELVFGLSLRQFSGLAGLTPAVVSRVESGRQMPSGKMLLAIRIIEAKRATRVARMRRVKGCNLTGDIVRIDRTGGYGNPFKVVGTAPNAVVTEWTRETRVDAVRAYFDWMLKPEQSSLLGIVTNFGGKTLACWCDPDLCHGHVIQALIRATPIGGFLVPDKIDKEAIWAEIMHASTVAAQASLIRDEQCLLSKRKTKP